VIHCQAMYWPMALPFTRVCATPIIQTLHHAPTEPEVALWSRYAEAPFIAISDEQARLLNGLNVVAVVQHAIDTEAFAFRAAPDDYLVFLGRFTEGKGVLQAIEVARRVGMRLVLAAAENDYYRDAVAPLVDGTRIMYAGEVHHADKVGLLGGARALLYPVQSGEPFGLVLPEAMASGTPVAALDRGAVREVVDEGVTGRVFTSLDELVAGLPSVLALDRAAVRHRAVERFGIERMVREYLSAYQQVMTAEKGSQALASGSRTAQNA